MKTFYLFSLLLFLFTGSNAQVTLRPGVRAGANFSQITRTYYEPRTDFYFGALGEIQLNNTFFLQPEIGFSRQGVKGEVYRLPEQGETDKVLIRKNIESNYLTWGVTGKLAFSRAVRILFGGSVEQSLEGREAIKPLRSTMDISLMAGAEYRFPFGLGVEFRLKRGTHDMIDSREYETFSSNRWLAGDRNLNLVMQAGLNYAFPLTR